MPVWPGVLLCVLAPHPACTRYKVRHARLVGGGSGTKFALLGQNLPNWAFLGEQGEFCTGSGAVRLVQGEFCTGSGAVRLVQGEFCTGSGAARLVQGEYCLAVAPSLFPVVGLASPVGAAARRRAP